MATTIDPCQVVTPDEASKLAGSKFGPSSATTMSNNAKLCMYGQEGLSFNVIVTAAPDAATAKAQEPAFKAEIEQAAADAGLGDMKLTEIPDFQPGVDAAVLSGTATVGGTKVEGIALYALKNAVLLALTDLAFGGDGPHRRGDGGRGEGRPRAPPVTAGLPRRRGELPRGAIDQPEGTGSEPGRQEIGHEIGSRFGAPTVDWIVPITHVPSTADTTATASVSVASGPSAARTSASRSA